MKKAFFINLLVMIALSMFGIHYSYAAGLRLISLTPATTEILFALGLDDDIVGVSSFCNWPPEARGKQSVGSFSRPNIELIIQLKPDMVFVTGNEQAGYRDILSELHIPTMSVDPSTVSDLMIDIEKIGAITGRKKQALEINRGINEVISNITQKVILVPHKDRPSVYVEIWHDPIMTAGGSSLVNDIIRIAGGRNIAFDLKRAYSLLDPEIVLDRNPDVIILTYMKDSNWISQQLMKRIGYSEVGAVKTGRVYSNIESDLLLRPGPRIAEGIVELHTRLYENP